MGHIVMPTGTAVYITELCGNINISQLIHDLTENDYTDSYRIGIVGALGKLGSKGTMALNSLKKMLEDSINGPKKNDLLAAACKHAIGKISGDVTKPETVWDKDINDNRGHHHSTFLGPTRNYTHTPVKKQVEMNNVTILPVDDDDDLSGGSRTYRQCSFCEKIVISNDYNTRLSEAMTKSKDCYCSFCLRNDYFGTINRHVMCLSFRGLIGYYYYAYTIAPKSSSMFLIDVQDHVQLHVNMGVCNPLFRYDYETFSWFIDFSKVGKRRVPVNFVLETIIQILATFNMYDNVKDASPQKFYKKYHDAVMLFANKRERQGGTKVFAPTMVDCDLPTKCPYGMSPIPIDLLDTFVPNLLSSDSKEKRKW